MKSKVDLKKALDSLNISYKASSDDQKLYDILRSYKNLLTISLDEKTIE